MYIQHELTISKRLSDGQLDKRCRRAFLEIFTNIKDKFVRLPNPLNIGFWLILQFARYKSVK
ncbi:hypothetical protein HanRHA438_Chr14g0681061 [Helianthus annuus]|nr:hypothetical protein HanRHA438_Chr14g0681061 [Helianthus annuus]